MAVKRIDRGTRQTSRKSTDRSINAKDQSCFNSKDFKVPSGWFTVSLMKFHSCLFLNIDSPCYKIVNLILSVINCPGFECTTFYSWILAKFQCVLYNTTFVHVTSFGPVFCSSTLCSIWMNNNFNSQTKRIGLEEEKMFSACFVNFSNFLKSLQIGYKIKYFVNIKHKGVSSQKSRPHHQTCHNQSLFEILNRQVFSFVNDEKYFFWKFSQVHCNPSHIFQSCQFYQHSYCTRMRRVKNEV